ncbi:MAG: hypothetical protein ACOYXB_09385 [Bacteroidota bacterium]
MSSTRRYISLLLALTLTGTGAVSQTIVISGAGTISSESGGYVVISGGEFELNTDATGSSTIDNLVIESNAGVSIPASTSNTINAVTIKSDASSSGSFINGGTLLGTRTGDVVERYMTKGVWHVISIPVSGQPISDFVTDAGNSIGYNSSLSAYGMMPYDPVNNVWDDFYTAVSAGNFTVGAGYMVRRKSSGTDGAVTSTGAIQTGDLNISGLTAGKWNAIGNPYTSSIGVTSAASTTDNFLDVNAASLDPSYAALYIWDEQPNYTGPSRSDYKLISNVGYNPELSKDYIQSGQGFLIKMESASTALDFTYDMQIYRPAESYLKKSTTPWYGLELSASTETFTGSTILAFHENMTTGLDPTYDAGVLKGNPELALYSRLPDNSGRDLGIQALPYDGFDSLIIPIGLDIPAGGPVTFRMENYDLPANAYIKLEDRETGVLTLLQTENETYSVVVPEGTYGSGRFYLYTGIIDQTDTTTTGSQDLFSKQLKVWSWRKTVYLEGHLNRGALLSLYATDGRKVSEWIWDGSGSTNAESVENGVYILLISDREQCGSYKLLLTE